MSAPTSLPCVAVLDTNVVFDWLVFGHPSSMVLAERIAAGQLKWICTPSMRDELAHVLARGVLDAWRPDTARLWETWEALSHTVIPPDPGLVPRLRCTDPDDQKFIELALHGAHWLLSRDRAVLKLARQASKLGLRIGTPEQWAATAQETPLLSAKGEVLGLLRMGIPEPPSDA